MRDNPSEIFTSLRVPLSFNTDNLIEVKTDNIPILVPEQPVGILAVDETQKYLIIKTKELLNEFLAVNPIEYKGEYFNVSADAQRNLSAVIFAGIQAQNLNISFTPMWNTINGQRKPYRLEDLQQLFIEIQNYIVPFVQQQQQLEEKILSTFNKQDLLNLDLKYKKEK